MRHIVDKKPFVVCFVLFVVILATVTYIKFHRNKAKPTPVEAIQEEIETTQSVVKQEIEKPNIFNVPAEKLNYVSSYPEALKLAKKHKREILLYFGAEWCSFCKKMKNETILNKEVTTKLCKEYVVCLIDVDQDKTTTNKYSVSGIPTYMVVNSQETILIRDSGFKAPANFLYWLQPKNVSLIEP